MAEESTLPEEQARTLLRLAALALGGRESRTPKRNHHGWAEITFAQLWESIPILAEYYHVTLRP